MLPDKFWPRAVLVPALLLSCPAWASVPRLKVFRCAQYLLSVRDRHVSAATSAAETARALDELHRFRARHLSSYDFTPGAVARPTTNRSGDARKRALARRLSAVLQEGRDSVGASATGAGERQITRAAVFEGEAEVASALAAIAEAAHAEEFVLSKTRLVNQMVLVISPMVSGLLSLPLLTIAAGLRDVGAWTIFGALAVAVRHEPEAAIRGYGGIERGPSLDERLRAELARSEGGDWSAFSSDYVVPEVVAGRLWMFRRVTGPDVVDYFTWKRYPKWSAKLTTPHFSVLPLQGGGVDVPLVHVRADVVLSRAGDGTPRLVVVTCLAKKLPEYPVGSGAGARGESNLVPRILVEGGSGEF